LSTVQVLALTTEQLVALTGTQLDAITKAQYCALTTAQIAAFTTDQVPHLALVTPIILDLNGDGVKTLSISSGVKFDLFAEGQSVNTGWVSSGDGLLVLDRNGDGSINDGSELFGSSTKLANGQKAADGYAALKELDTNGDGVISSDDAQFAELRVWVDSNSDGVSQTGELKTLTSLGISSINAQAKVDLSIDNGNLVGLTSSYQTTDGATHAAADVWFVADQSSTNAAPAASDTSLRALVSGLAQAMGSFSTAGTAKEALPGTQLDATTGVATAATSASLAVMSMVDVMKQFDANGGLIGSSTTTASLGKSLNLPGVQDPVNTVFLTIGTGK